MGQPVAKRGDRISATDTHLIQPPGPVPTIRVPHPFNGVIDGALSENVNIEGRPAAMVNSTATNNPPHAPIGGSFVKPPSNRATIISGSATVFINRRPAARNGDTALTCNDPADQPVGSVQAASSVRIG